MKEFLSTHNNTLTTFIGALAGGAIAMSVMYAFIPSINPARANVNKSATVSTTSNDGSGSGMGSCTTESASAPAGAKSVISKAAFMPSMHHGHHVIDNVITRTHTTTTTTGTTNTNSGNTSTNTTTNTNSGNTTTNSGNTTTTTNNNSNNTTTSDSSSNTTSGTGGLLGLGLGVNALNNSLNGNTVSVPVLSNNDILNDSEVLSDNLNDSNVLNDLLDVKTGIIGGLL